MTARWAGTTPYSAGTVILPTVDNGRCFYAAAGGTSGGSEPTWPARFTPTNPNGGVVDGTVEWTPYTIIQPSTLRLTMNWDVPSGATASGVYSNWIIGNALLDAIAFLERATKRHFVNRPGAALTWTSMLRATLPIPGLRTASSVIYGGTTLTSSAYWLQPDFRQSGVYTSIQFRAFRVHDDDGPWWLADPLWFDKAEDSPFYPGNYGGGYVFTSMPNDTTITGDWGYDPGSEPMDLYQPLLVRAAYELQRPASLLADSVITPQGGVLNYAQLPAEVRDFIAGWSTGQQVVSIG
jgi:hypothetical protein